METKKCKRCSVTKSIEEFSKSNRTEDGYSVNCNRCKKVLNSFYKVKRDTKKQNINSVFEYIKSLKNKRSYCMNCGRPFNYTIQLEGTVYDNKYKEVARDKDKLIPIKKTDQGLYLCDECYEDIENGKRFNIDGKSVSITDINQKEYNKLFKDYKNPYKEREQLLCK